MIRKSPLSSLYRENQLSIWDESLNGLDIRKRKVIEFLLFINDPIHPIHPSSIARYKMNWIVNTKLNNFFKGILTIFNWG